MSAGVVARALESEPGRRLATVDQRGVDPARLNSSRRPGAKLATLTGEMANLTDGTNVGTVSIADCHPAKGVRKLTPFQEAAIAGRRSRSLPLRLGEAPARVTDQPNCGELLPRRN